MKDVDQIKVNLPKALKDKFKAKAKKNDSNQSDAVRKLIIKYVNDGKDT